METEQAPLTAAKNSQCEVCETRGVQTWYCVNCDGHFCATCWPKERPHRQGKVGPDGLPHEQADLEVVSRLRATFTPPSDPEIQLWMHLNDEDTTWFGMGRDTANQPIFQDYGRYATLIANGASGEHMARFPRLVSFIGQTGAGKSTLVKMIIEKQFSAIQDSEIKHMFPTPVVGSVLNDNVPTSGDVHLYADPSSYLGIFPMFYADCEGLEGGENTPIGSRHRNQDQAMSRSRSDSNPDPNRLKKRWRLSRAAQRNITWADSPEKQKRQYGVTELYPRILYTFSDVIVFVLQNPKTFESSVVSKLLSWAAAVVEKSTNQPVLPHAIIVLNATDVGVDEREWDVDFATEVLMNSVAGAVGRDAKYMEYSMYWSSHGRAIRTIRDLLECYYSSIRVVRIPHKGRYMLVEKQVEKLYQEVQVACEQSYNSKRNSRMLANSDELNQYLQAAFDHFSQNLDLPFNFIEVAFKNSPIPRDFAGNILKLAVAVRGAMDKASGPDIFGELSLMVASCMVLDCTRHGLKGSAIELFKRNYQRYCEDALKDFCKLFWPCEFKGKLGNCVNILEGHQKGHQNDKGKIIGSGEYISSFSFSSYLRTWLHSILTWVKKFQRWIADEMRAHPSIPERDLVSELHRRNVQGFYERLKGSMQFISHSACFCCLREMPEHPLPCGHVLCTPCVVTYSELDGKGKGIRSSDKYLIRMDRCPLHPPHIRWTEPWFIKFKPDSAGVRILSLDGGGIRGIVMLEVLKALEVYLGGHIPIQAFFDLIVGTSTGGIIAMGLGVQNWRVETCIKHFLKLSDKAFTHRLPGMRLGRKYKTRPFEQSLQEVFRDEYLFGGIHEEPNSYWTRVAITSTTDTGERPVIFTNYNREAETQPSYSLIRPDHAENELKLWEVLRATSAAPGYFKPFIKRDTNEGYLDGAMYHNNPVRVAYHESKLLWPDIRDCQPDILLSLGTGHNGEETTGSAEPFERRWRRAEISSDIIVTPSPRQRKLGFGEWLKNYEFVYNLSVMANRIDNILNSEQIWVDFKSEKLSLDSSEIRRYQRINPKLGYRPPRLDDKEQLENLRNTVREKLRMDEQYRKKITRVAHHLVASSFYFERKRQEKIGGGYYQCQGRILCKFLNGSEELRHLGSFLRGHQVHETFQPYFHIREQHQQPVELIIEPVVVEKMFTRSFFDMGLVNVQVSDKHGPVTISLALWDCSGREDIIPISGFPRKLVLNSLRGSPSDIGKSRKIGLPRRNLGDIDTICEDRLSSLFDIVSDEEESEEIRPITDPLKDWRGDGVDWVDRRAGRYFPLSTTHMLGAPSASAFMSRTDSRPSARRTPLSQVDISVANVETGLGITIQPPSAHEPRESLNLPRSALVGGGNENRPRESLQAPSEDSGIEVDKDERDLAKAIELSLQTSNRWTANGTNLEELRVALSMSQLEQ